MTSMPEGGARGRRGPTRHAAQREARRLALAAIFEAEFGLRTSSVALERALEETPDQLPSGEHARAIVGSVARHGESIDAWIGRLAPTYPVDGLAFIDRALLRSALGEVLHCPTTPIRVAISEWVELARTYSGEPARRLLNGVLGRVATEMAETARES
jgi:N utilization substance protein B